MVVYKAFSLLRSVVTLRHRPTDQPQIQFSTQLWNFSIVENYLIVCTVWVFICSIVLCPCSVPCFRRRPLHSADHRYGQPLQLCFSKSDPWKISTPRYSNKRYEGKLNKQNKKVYKADTTLHYILFSTLLFLHIWMSSISSLQKCLHYTLILRFLSPHLISPSLY